jgi:hypothetical protein
MFLLSAMQRQRVMKLASAMPQATDVPTKDDGTFATPGAAGWDGGRKHRQKRGLESADTKPSLVPRG